MPNMLSSKYIAAATLVTPGQSALGYSTVFFNRQKKKKKKRKDGISEIASTGTYKFCDLNHSKRKEACR